VSDLRSRPLRHALKQAAVTGTAGSFLLGAAVVGAAVPATSTATAAPATTTAAPGTTTTTAAPGTTTTTTTAAPVTIYTEQVASKRKRVDVKKMLRTAASLKGRPYRWGATGPRAFDCSGYTLYVLKKQGIKLPRTAAQQYGKTKRVSAKKAKVGDLVFFFNSGRVTHVGILAGKMKMWAAPHSGAKVRLQKVYGKNWKIGRIV
jgi:cell wall-associated NlpC family hydrolase